MNCKFVHGKLSCITECAHIRRNGVALRSHEKKKMAYNFYVCVACECVCFVYTIRVNGHTSNLLAKLKIPLEENERDIKLTGMSCESNDKIITFKVLHT